MTLCINPHCDKPQNSDNAQFCQNCQSELLLKQRYRATKILGEGGFGKTYEASDLGTCNKVIKVLINNSPKAVELFQREAEVLSQLDNPGIPRVEPNSYIVFHPANSQETVHCLVMEKVEGGNLRDYLKQLRTSIDSETAERWLRELVLILQEVHENDILHRDIKPQNIIFKPDGRLALIDFGAVREGTGTQVATSAAGSSGTEVSSYMAGGTSVVSRGYTAPEQMNGQALRQSDFYSLGRTFIFLLTGKEPSEITYDAYNDVLEWRKQAPNVESKLAELLDQMQSTQVKQRPTAQEILQKLEKFSQPQSVEEKLPSNSESRKSTAIQGEDIEVEVKIDSYQARLGTTKEISFIRTIYQNGLESLARQETSMVRVSILPNSKEGDRIQLKEQGNEGLNGGLSGAVYVRLISAVPDSSSPKPHQKSGILKFLVRGLGVALSIFLVKIIFGNFLGVSNNSYPPSVNSTPSIPNGYPKPECGTGVGYTVSILYTQRNFDRISKDFCLDVASYKKVVTAENGNEILQVSSFRTQQEAAEFEQVLAQYFNSSEVYRVRN